MAAEETGRRRVGVADVADPHAEPWPAMLESCNPATGELIDRVPFARPDTVRAAFARARAAQPGWAARAITERARVVRAFRRRMLGRADWLTRLISEEQGRPQVEALLHEITAIADISTFYANHAVAFLRDETPPLHLMKYKRSLVHYAPYGVVAVIAPWNFPFMLPASEVIRALLAGNTVVLKPSELTPLTGAAIAELFAEAGLPPGVLEVVQGDGRTGAAVVQAPPDKITFIGGAETGKRILALAAPNLTPVTLELGGKDPLIVLEDANLDRAADLAVWGGFTNAGQACASVERVYVARTVADAFIAKVVARTRRLRVGWSTGPEAGVEIGPMTSARQLAIVERQVREAVAQGARIVAGGRTLAGRYFEPAVLVDVRDEMRVMREETFGPVIAIATFETEDEAVRRANDSPFGLCASVVSRDRRRAEALARRLEAGSVMINDVAISYAAPETPWGGVKQSGIGRVHWGAHGLRDYCQPRHILSERFRPLPRDVWSFPYRQGAYRWLLRGLRLVWGW